MNSDRGIPVSMFYPGHKSRKLAKISKSVLLVLLTLLGIGAGLPSTVPGSFPDNSTRNTSTANPSSILKSQTPQTVGANTLSDLSLPRTVVTNVDDMIGGGGVIRDSPDNLTLFNSAIRLRLIGGAQPRDELLGESRIAIGSSSFWRIEAMAGKSWVPLQPRSNNFTILGTNITGTFVVRTMKVGNGALSGILTISYEATSVGPLRWDLKFSASNTAQYRMVFDWKNTTGTIDVSASSKSFRESYGRENYTMSWADVPSSLYTAASVAAGEFLLSIDLGIVSSGSQVFIDPTIVDSNTSALATAYGSDYGSQRKVFYEPKSAYYWLFYYNGSGTVYRNSHDGTQWSAPQAIPNGWPYNGGSLSVEPPSVYNIGQTIMVAEGLANSTDVVLGGVRTASAYYIVGAIHGSSITWGSTASIGKAWTAQTCTETTQGSTCMVVGTRYVSIGLSSKGNWTFSLNWYAHVGSFCARSFLSLIYGSKVVPNVTDTGYHCGNSPIINDNLGSAIVAADPNGLMRIIYQNETFFQGVYNSVLASRTADASHGIGPVDTIVNGARRFSVVSDDDFVVHVTYDDGADYGTSYAYRAVNDKGWTYSTDIFSGGYNGAQLTLDQSTNTVYAVATNSPFGSAPTGSVIAMKSKAPSQHWSDSSNVFPITGKYIATYLASDYASASATNGSQVTMIWTDRYTSSPKLMFASIPIDTAWSPYASPSDPWDGNGLAPYGQYFANLNEYVSPSTGMLTVKQTDLTLPGRGLNLDLTMIYTEPHSFLGGAAYNYENYPWAPMGLGWQLDFPWMTQTSAPLYMHLWDGEGYRIPYSFWTNPAPTRFENHEGDGFLMIRNSTGVFLYDRSGVADIFDLSHSNRLTNIIDTNGNKVQFGYNANNQIANITDTIQRVFQFCYSGGLLSNINQTSGSCAGNSGSVRGVAFKYSGSSLTRVYDPAGRNTTYTYNAFASASVSPWLVSQIIYPTGGYTNYTYTPSLTGTQASSYRVSKQYVGTAANPNSYIRSLNYFYRNGAGDQVSNSTIVTYDGSTSKAVSYTSYSFSFAGVTWNISDSNHNFLHGVQQLFGVHGEVPQETILVSPTQGYTNYYRYDLWGNLIYKREVINPSTNWYHESFNAYYNDGLPPGFNAFQETLSQNQGNQTDNLWHASTSGSWIVRNGVYNGTDTTGNQFNTFVWANMSTPNVSIRARVYVARQEINSTGQAGLFVHYPGTGTGKWSLDLDVTPNGLMAGPILEDDAPGSNDHTAPPDPGISCLPPSKALGFWYTFNLTIQGSYAMGTIQPDGQSACTTQHYFTSGSGPTGFGLQVTGLSVKFDNITATTSTPFITGAGFSNSFNQNGGPGPNVHNAIAGTAEFQNVTSGVPPIPLETYYGHNFAGELTQTRQLGGSPPAAQWLTTVNTYDSFGNLKTFTDGRGNQTSYGYSAKYQSAYLTSVNETLVPGGTLVSKRYSYNFTMGSQISSIDPNGYNTTYRYDIMGRRTGITYPSGQGNVSYTYNDAGNYVDITNENGWHTRNIYDGLGRLTTVERFSKGTPYSNESYSYNWMNKMVSQTNPLGKTTTYTYDALGRPTKILKPDGNYTTLTYNDVNSFVKSVDENGYYKYQNFDRQGRLISIVQQAPFQPPYTDYTTNYYYDEVGNLRQTKDAGLQTTRYSYDGLNHLLKTTYPDKTLETYSYDNNGNVVTKVDRKGLSSTYSYDSLSMPLTVTTLANPVSVKTYSYDNNGNILSLGSTNATIAYTYDSRNRITAETYSVNGNFSLSVFPHSVNFFCTPTNCNPTTSNANLTATSINGFSGTIALSYNSQGLSGGTQITGPASVFLPSGGKVSTTITAYLGTQSGNYNWTIQGQSGISTSTTGYTISEYICSRNCPTSPIGGPSLQSLSSPSSPSAPIGSSGVAASYRVGYAYAGELVSNITYPDNILLHYGYDSLGRAVNASRISGVFVTPYVNLAYNKNDQLTYVGYYNGFQSNFTYSNYTYDSLGRTATITLVQPGKKSNLTILSLNYQYNRTGTVASVTGLVNGSPVNEQYQYDPLKRLVYSLVVSNGRNTNASYGYDHVGNLQYQNVNGLVTFQNYNVTNNELTSVQSPNTISYSYDPDGNLLSHWGASAPTWTFTWDAASELLRVANNGVTQGVYAYDAQGRRVESVESSTIFYAYLGTETLYENNTTSKTITDYIYADGMRFGKLSGGVINYYHEDVLGSTRLVTDPSGNVLFADGYQPFGQDSGTPTSSQTYRFTGKPASQSTGLYYEYQRWYDPSIGRFISRDPLSGTVSDPQSLNGYVYVENLPTSVIDPTGAVSQGLGCDGELCEGGIPVADQVYDNPDGVCTDSPRMCNFCQDNPFEFHCDYSRPPNPDDTGSLGSSPSTGSGEPGAITITPSEGDLPRIQVERVAVNGGGFEEARAEGIYGNQRLETARGNYFHTDWKALDKAAGYQTGELSPGNIPDAYRSGEVIEYKPFHEGIDPLKEYGSTISRYQLAYREAFGTELPLFRLILYVVL